jgi:hypothetical protein
MLTTRTPNDLIFFYSIKYEYFRFFFFGQELTLKNLLFTALSPLPMAICPWLFARGYLAMAICLCLFARACLPVPICLCLFARAYLPMPICLCLFACAYLPVPIFPWLFACDYLPVAICPWLFARGYFPVAICTACDHLPLFENEVLFGHGKIMNNEVRKLLA